MSIVNTHYKYKCNGHATTADNTNIMNQDGSPILPPQQLSSNSPLDVGIGSPVTCIPSVDDIHVHAKGYHYDIDGHAAAVYHIYGVGDTMACALANACNDDDVCQWSAERPHDDVDYIKIFVVMQSTNTSFVTSPPSNTAPDDATLDSPNPRLLIQRIFKDMAQRWFLLSNDFEVATTTNNAVDSTSYDGHQSIQRVSNANEIHVQEKQEEQNDDKCDEYNLDKSPNSITLKLTGWSYQDVNALRRSANEYVSGAWALWKFIVYKNTSYLSHRELAQRISQVPFRHVGNYHQQNMSDDISSNADVFDHSTILMDNKTSNDESLPQTVNNGEIKETEGARAPPHVIVRASHVGSDSKPHRVNLGNVLAFTSDYKQVSTTSFEMNEMSVYSNDDADNKDNNDNDTTNCDMFELVRGVEDTELVALAPGQSIHVEAYARTCLPLQHVLYRSVEHCRYVDCMYFEAMSCSRNVGDVHRWSDERLSSLCRRINNMLSLHFPWLTTGALWESHGKQPPLVVVNDATPGTCRIVVGHLVSSPLFCVPSQCYAAIISIIQAEQQTVSCPPPLRIHTTESTMLFTCSTDGRLPCQTIIKSAAQSISILFSKMERALDRNNIDLQTTPLPQLELVKGADVE